MSGPLSERHVRAVRKPHLCWACDKWIYPGESALTCVGVTDGQFWSLYYHHDCRQAELELNELHEWWYNDEWMRLCEAESDDYDWLSDTHPGPYERMRMTRVQYENVYHSRTHREEQRASV
jgi:hypothetical protein